MFLLARFTAITLAKLLKIAQKMQTYDKKVTVEYQRTPTYYRNPKIMCCVLLKSNPSMNYGKIWVGIDSANTFNNMTS